MHSKNNGLSIDESLEEFITESGQVKDTGDDLAGRGQRLLAVFIDFCIGTMYVLPLAAMIGAFDPFFGSQQPLELPLLMWFPALVFLIFVLIHGFFLRNYGQTIGKRIVGIKITDLDGNLPSFRKLIFLRYLPLTIVQRMSNFGNIVLLADALFVCRANRRCLHDILAGTIVVQAHASRRHGLVRAYLFLLALFIFVPLLTLAGFQLEEELSPTATEWIAEVEDDSVSEAFLYLYGMRAPEGADVLETGTLRFQAYQRAERLAVSNVKEVDFDDPLIDKLDMPERGDDLYVGSKEAYWLDSVLNESDRWATELEKRRTLYERYLHFLNYTEFRTMFEPRSSANNPPYGVLRRGARLRTIDCLQMSKEGHGLLAIQLLCEDISKIRRLLAAGDTLTHKMLFSVLIYWNLEVINYVSTTNQLVLNLEIPPLSQEEFQMEKPLKREFVINYHTYKEADQHPDLLSQTIRTPAWLGRILLKPNNTNNESLVMFQRLIALSKLSQAEFAAADVAAKRRTNIFNILGSYMVNTIADLEYHIFIARVHDLNCLISMTNHCVSGASSPLANPYYPDKKVMITDGGVFCMEGPFEDENEFRCIHR